MLISSLAVILGRTPPCTDTIITIGGIRRVFAGMKDPNRLVQGKGIRALKGSWNKGLNRHDEKRL